MDQQKTVSWKLWLLQGAIIIVALTAVYGKTLDYPFVFDDEPTITDNPHIRILWPLTLAMEAPYQSPVSGRPIVSLSFMANYGISGLHPWSYRLGNLMIHLVNCLLLLAIIRHCTRHVSWIDGRWFAFGVILLWAVHPLNIDAVAYVTQRTELMVSMFMLLTLYCGIQGWQHEKPFVWLLASVAACAFGMLTKENMVAMPVIVYLYDRTFASGSAWLEPLKKRPRYYACLAATWIVMIVSVSAGHRSLSVGFDLGWSAWDYFSMQCQVLIWYLGYVFWPQGLVIHHETHPPKELLAYLPQMLLLTAAGLLTLWAVWKRHPLGVAGVVFFAVLAPSSSFVPILTEPMAERRMYIPMVAVLLILAAMVGYILHRRTRYPHRLASMLLTVLVVVAIIMSALRVTNFQDHIDTWKETLVIYPESTFATNNLGVAYLREGDYETALSYFLRTDELLPGHPVARTNVAFVLIRTHQYAQAEKILRPEVERQTDPGRALGLLALALYHQGKAEESLAYFEQSLLYRNHDVTFMNNYATALEAVGRYEEAIEQFRNAFEYESFFMLSRLNHVKLLVRTGRFEEAIFFADQIFNNFTPTDQFPQLHDLIAVSHMVLEQPERAREHYEKAIALDPDNGVIQGRYARVLLELGELEQAKEHLLALEGTSVENAPSVFNAWGYYYEAIGDLEQAADYRSRAAQAAQDLEDAGLPSEASQMEIKLETAEELPMP